MLYKKLGNEKSIDGRSCHSTTRRARDECRESGSYYRVIKGENKSYRRSKRGLDWGTRFLKSPN